MMKGLSFNVTLSEEQMDHIAALSADKVNYTLEKIQNTELWKSHKLEDLENENNKLSRIIIEKELQIVQLNKFLDRYKERIKEMKNKE